MKIKRVFVGTIPHLTILPIIRWVGKKSGDYYEYYTRPWIWDSSFNPKKHPHLTENDIKKIDATIDSYNEVIQSSAKKHGWHIVDICALFDKCAFRRNNGRSSVPWPVEAVAALHRNKATQYLVDQQGKLNLDTRYLRGSYDRNGIIRIEKGGLIGLDGMHPTVLFYGLMAHIFIEEMVRAGVRTDAGEVPAIDWDELVQADSLLCDPPVLLADLKKMSNVMTFSFFNIMDRVCFNPE